MSDPYRKNAIDMGLNVWSRGSYVIVGSKMIRASTIGCLEQAGENVVYNRDGGNGQFKNCSVDDVARHAIIAEAWERRCMHEIWDKEEKSE